MLDKFGVVKVDPVFKSTPPEIKSYQLIVAPDEAFNTTEPFPQREAFVVVGAAAGKLIIALTLTRGDLQVFPVSA